MPLLMIDLNGLAVPPAGGSGGAVAGVTHRHCPPGQPVQNVTVEHLAHQPQVLVGGKDAVIIDYNAAALLPPVLKGIEPIVDDPPHIGGFRTDDAKHAARFMNCHSDLLTIKKGQRRPLEKTSLPFPVFYSVLQCLSTLIFHKNPSSRIDTAADFTV